MLSSGRYPETLPSLRISIPGRPHSPGKCLPFLLLVGLSPVVEVAQTEEPSSSGIPAAKLVRHSQQSVPESPGDAANISGTTFLATDSEHEPRDVETGLMIEALPDLLAASNKVLAFLAPSNVSEASILKALGSPYFPMRLNRLKDAFEAQKQCFGSQHFISLPSARMLPLLKRARWQPDGILQKANLTRLALDMFLIGRHASSEKQLLELDSCFPLPFISMLLPTDQGNPGPGESRIISETLELALEIRTQGLIAALNEAENTAREFNPHAILADAFNMISIGDDDQQEIRGWDINDLQDDTGALPYRFKEKVHQRIELIRQHFLGDGPYQVDFANLESTFPWPTFLVEVARWIRMRADEIDEQLASQGPVDKLVGLVQEAEQRASLDQRSSRSSQPQTHLDNFPPTVVTDGRASDLPTAGEEPVPTAKQVESPLNAKYEFFPISQIIVPCC
jgi:hypothetical protein